MLNLCFFVYPKPHRGEGGGEDSLTENLLEPGHLEEDYAVRTFLQTKDSQTTDQ